MCSGPPACMAAALLHAAYGQLQPACTTNLLQPACMTTGCGSGRFVLLLSQRMGAHCNVLGLDIHAAVGGEGGREVRGVSILGFGGL